MRTDKKSSQKGDKRASSRAHNRGVVGYSKKSALLEEAITHMNAGKYGRSSAALKELLSLDPQNTEARRLFATLHLRLGSLVPARQAFESLAKEAIERQDLWLAESLLREYLAAGPRCVPFLELLAHVQEEKGDAMAAVVELGKAIDILIESPDSESPQKPSQLYAKMRDLAPASPVALQLSSLFDIQTGELLVPPPTAPATETSSDIVVSSLQGDIRTLSEPAKASDVMPWELFGETPPNPRVSPPIIANHAIESTDVPDGPVDLAAARSVPHELEPSPSGSTGLSQEANFLDQGIAPLILNDPTRSSSEDHDNKRGDLTVERSPFVEEESTSSSSEERLEDVERVTASSTGSSELSSPMPWEQIENSTIKIEETSSSPPPLDQSERASLLGGESVLAPSSTPQPELVPDRLSGPPPVTDPTEPGESIFAVEPSTSPAELPEPDPPAPSPADSSPKVPFSWNTVFDGAWKFAVGTLPTDSSSALSKEDTASQDAQTNDSVGPESVSVTALFSPSGISTPASSVISSDLEPLLTVHPPTLSEVSGSVAETDAARTSDVPRPTTAFLSEDISGREGAPTVSSDATSSFKIDTPVPPLSESVEPTPEPDPDSSPSFMTPQSMTVATDFSVSEPSHSAVIQEEPSAPAAAEDYEIPLALVKPAEVSPPSAPPDDSPSPPSVSTDTSSRWSTGEVEVQRHRPSKKKRNWDKEKGEAPLEPPAPLPQGEESPKSPKESVELLSSGGWESAPSEPSPVVEEAASIQEKVAAQEDTRPDWVRASESITFVSTPTPSSATWQDSDAESTHSSTEAPLSSAASAVDVLFDSTGEKSRVSTRDRVASPRPRPRFAARVARVRIGISSFIGSCFSTTRSIVLLCVGLALACVVLAAITIGAIGLAWMVMESSPSSTYHNLTESPPSPHIDSTKNGYFLLLGFDVTEEQDPVQAGYDRKVEGSDLQAANACMSGGDGKGTTGSSAEVIRGWFTGADPVAKMKSQAASVRSWAAQEALALKRYQQWLSMSFEDAGYGQILSPNCAHILLAHQLYLAEGFSQDLSIGLGRLESDMGAWRMVLGQSKTLMVKMLAATAVQDDVAIVSGLLTRQDLDEAVIGRLGAIVRPLDQVELSLRWPMQSHLVWGTKAVTKSLKNNQADERPFYVSLAAAMPLPVQRRSNAYADYYEAASKAMAEGRYTNLPKPSGFIRTSAVSTVDYVANPIEHIIGIEPLPSWDPYVGQTVETDARLRLARLQVWIRQGARDGNVVTRLAKAGQAYYDPFTGLPMLLNQQKGVMYSVGKDGKDQEGDPHLDVVTIIPKTQSVGGESSRSVLPSRSK